MPKFGMGKRDFNKIERDRDIDGIVEFLRDEDDKVVFEAIEALTRIGDPGGIEAMMALVADVTTSDLIRAKAWLALDVGIEHESKKRTDWR